MTVREIEPSDMPFMRRMNYLAGFKNSGSDPDQTLSFEEAQQERL
jgi:hypothetical protein